jgi:hypothetical protein
MADISPGATLQLRLNKTEGKICAAELLVVNAENQAGLGVANTSKPP